MTRKKWLLIGAAILGLSGIAVPALILWLKLTLHLWLEEQVNNVINGSIDYDSLRINWNGDVVLTECDYQR